MGKLEVLDLRQHKMAGALKGFAGSVTALDMHQTEPLLAAVGLDRFVRIYSSATRQVLGKAFLKQQLTGVAFCPTDVVLSTEPQAQEQAAEAGTEGSTDPPAKRRRHRKGQH